MRVLLLLRRQMPSLSPAAIQRFRTRLASAAACPSAHWLVSASAYPKALLCRLGAGLGSELPCWFLSAPRCRLDAEYGLAAHSLPPVRLPSAERQPASPAEGFRSSR